jgi:hypothetical protein
MPVALTADNKTYTSEKVKKRKAKLGGRGGRGEVVKKRTPGPPPRGSSARSRFLVFLQNEQAFLLLIVALCVPGSIDSFFYFKITIFQLVTVAGAWW